MFIVSSLKCVELEVVVLSMNCLTYPKLFYFMDKSVQGRSCISQLVKSQQILLVHEVFRREGWVNYKEPNTKHNNGWSRVFRRQQIMYFKVEDL